MNKIEFIINPKALIIGFVHPYKAIQMMADRIAAALVEQGYAPATAMIGDKNLPNQLSAINDSSLKLIIFLGSIPLNLHINKMHIWKFIPKNVKCIEIILDSLPYDYRIPGFVNYLNDFATSPNYHLASFEGNIAKTLTEFTGKNVFHLHHGAYTIAKKTSPKKNSDRLMFWGSIGAELGKNDATDDLLSTLIQFNVWGLNKERLFHTADAMKVSNNFYGFSELSNALDISLKDLLRPEWIQALCAIDSALKRYRRLFLIESILDFPLDIYGKNWEQYLPKKSDIRIMNFIPDDNSVFSYACQEYAGVVNIDPNWGNGTNERAITALALGINVASNKNEMIKDIVGHYPYVLDRQSIRDACKLALDTKNVFSDLPQFSWNAVIKKLLIECADQERM